MIIDLCINNIYSGPVHAYPYTVGDENQYYSLELGYL